LEILIFHMHHLCCDESHLTGRERPPNDWRISRRRVTRHAPQELIRYINETGNNIILDQAIGCCAG